MNPGATAERVLEALRRQILEANFRPGDRLDPGVIASQLASSITPVRDALNRLTGEGLVEARPGGGFHLPALDEPLLQDQYRWSEQMLRVAISSWPAGRQLVCIPLPAEDSQTSTLADLAGTFLLSLAARSDNAEHAAAIDRLNARLHVVRNIEASMIDAAPSEFDDWIAAIEKDDRRSLQLAIGRYHRRRRRLAGAIVRVVYRRE